MSRDHESLAQAYRLHSTSVHGLARRLTHDSTLADDVVQEVFLRLWRSPERYDPFRGTLRSYLLSHAHGRSVDLIRSEAARRSRQERHARRSINVSAPPDDEVWASVEAERLRAALLRLEDKERRAIELAYFDGLTYRQVAEFLGEPEGTVKSRIRSGMKRLKTALVREGIGSR
ncbi:MAG TPA: sigma-70 family RNA polymerase sigma factor [Acidimicrobiia bacterium]|jgi:RNA polymerase sigma-70 factor (ECF subfamily)|nr:sigma-70 family RNA polymerase sigma factor [Acidimicrobiia bacterium]